MTLDAMRASENSIAEQLAEIFP